VVDGATGTSFSLANFADQSEGFANADFASFDGTVNRTTGSNAVNFELQRRMTQVKVKIADVDTKFADTDENTYTFDVTVYSPSTSIAVSDGTVTGSGTALEVTPYGGKGMTKATTDPAVAIITPGAAATADFIAVQVKKNGEAVGSKLIASERPELLAGYSYTFNLTVKKDRINISSVQLTDWEDVSAIDGGAASEYVIDLDQYSTSADVYAKIKSLNTDLGVTSISFKGNIKSMSLQDFFFKDGTWLPIERINLSSISDLTVIPENCFCFEDDSKYVPESYPNKSLKSITATQVTQIGRYTFQSCEALETVTLPLVKSVPDASFCSCIMLKTINMPSVTSVGHSAFLGCTSLTSVNFPLAESIGQWAFGRCTSLESVKLPVATSFSNDIFLNCTTTNIDLTLSASQKSNVSGTTWTYTSSYGNSYEYSYTFKSITFAE
jgi:hypothetical protein